MRPVFRGRIPEGRMATIAAAVRIIFQPVEDLPVRRLYMVGLVERLHCQLPVARQRDGSIPAEAQLLEFIVPATLVDGIEELLKRFRVVIHVDEHEAAPRSEEHTSELQSLMRTTSA